MAKKPQKVLPLTTTEIILRGDAETIRAALEARLQIDKLLEEREAAYRRIAVLEEEVATIVGEDSTFPFPEPPLPIAEFVKPAAPKKKAEPKVESTVGSEPASDDTLVAHEEGTSAPSAEDSPDTES